MAISFPRTDVLDAPQFDQKFMLMERQEFSRQASGITRGKSFGSALWSVSYTSTPQRHRDAVDHEAILNSLDGVINEFYAHDLRRPFPRAHADGVFDDTGEIASLNVNNKALALKALPAGFVLSRGDYLAFDYGTGPSRALHQVMETVTADGSGETPEFEVRPHIRPGAAVDAPVMLKTPSARFILVPASLQPSMGDPRTTSLTFSAIQSL